MAGQPPCWNVLNWPERNRYFRRLPGLSEMKHRTKSESMRWSGDATKQATTFGGLTRSMLMARIRSSGNATTELSLAALLRVHRLAGWRRQWPIAGKPDFAWPARRLAVFVDGCFWHGHDCGRNLSPHTNARAWRAKIAGNQARDRRTVRCLREKGWRVVRIWECALKKNPLRCVRQIQQALALAIVVNPSPITQ